MIKESNGNVSDKQMQGYLMTYEREMIPRGFKWVMASEEGHDLFDTDNLGGMIKFCVIISIVRVIKYVTLFASLLTQLFNGRRKILVERGESANN